jgi:putative ABC transport system permease protein
MTRLRILLSRLGEIVFRGSREDRVDAEIAHHLQMLADEMEAGGLSRREAELAARKQFGGVDKMRMVHREQRGLPMIDMLIQDVRFALRVLRRDRGFALTAVLVLGVGLGVNNMFFTLVWAHKFRGVEVHEVDRVMFMSTLDDRVPFRLMSLPEFEELRASQTSFSGLAAFVNGVTTIADEGRTPERFDTAYVTANAFPLLGLSPSLGRLPTPENDRPFGDPIVLLGRDVWQRRYNSDPQILGRTVQIDGVPVTVVGIIPERSGFPSTASIWLPLGQFADLKADRATRQLRVLARLRDGVSEAAGRREVETIFAGFESAHPESNRHVRGRVVPLNQQLLGTLDGWMQFILAGLIVILVACANVANLMMARAIHRAPEIAIRTSLGASRLRLVCQLMVEAVVISAGGAAVGAVISVLGVRAVESGIPDFILPYWTDYEMDSTVFLALVMLSLITVVVFGLIPAWHASRTDVNRTLKDSTRAVSGGRGMRAWSNAFLTIELALAMILVVQVAVTSYLANDQIPTDANINTTDVLTAAITLPPASYPSSERRADYFARLEERLRARAEITGVSRTTVLPGEGTAPRRLRIRGQEPPAGSPTPTILTIDIAPDYFEALGLSILRGRAFDARDGSPARSVAIVNDRFAQVFLDGGDPLGMQIAVTSNAAPSDTPPQWLTVIGVAPVIRQQSAGGVEEQSPAVYVPIATLAPVTSTLMVRHRVDPDAAASVVRAEAQAVDPSVPLYRMRSLGQAVRDGQWTRHTSAVLADTVTWMSVLLAIVGLYAVTSHRVTLKTREIGLRMALGARRFQIASVIIAGLGAPLLLGLLLGTAGAMAWDGTYSTGLAGVYASAPPTLLKSAAFITVLVIVSCFIPLRRATATNPINALRHD